MNESELEEWVDVLSKDAAESLRLMMQTPNCSWLRYEDLVSSPDGAAVMLKDKLGLDCSAERLWSRMNFSFLRTSQGNNRFFASADWQRPITTRNVGQYKLLLTKRQIAIVENHCIGIMKELRYL